MHRLLAPVAFISLTAFAVGCSSDAPPAETTGDVTQRQTARVCTAIRGNGERIFSHFASLARITEHYGLLYGSAGGSSGSISTFVAESVHLNPWVTQCGEAKCSAREAAARAALLFKATEGYFEVLAASDEAAAFLNLAPLVQQIAAQDLGSLAETDVDEARAALEAILASEDLRDLVNPEVVHLLENSPDPAFHINDLVDMAQGYASFSTEEPSILIRPGFIDFGAVAEKVGRIGSFFAGYEPVDAEGMQAFLAACATPGRGLSWAEVAQLPAGDTTCGDYLRGLVVDFRSKVIEGEFPSRIDDPMGQGFHSLVATSVMTGATADAWRQARADYNAAQPWSFEGDFADVRLGYFGASEDLAAVEANERGYDDEKTRRYLGLGEVAWRDALTFSPAEPGLARALELNDTLVSAGGWPDLHPVLALENIGCEKVVYITRAGEESGFATGVATLLGAAAEDLSALYDVNNPESGFAQSLVEADATWCTRWDAFSGFDLPGITGDAYGAEMVTDDPYFLDAPDAYTRPVSRATGALGCAPPDAAN